MQPKHAVADRTALRSIPAVSHLISLPRFRKIQREVGHGLIVDLLREELARIRAGVLDASLQGDRLRAAIDPAALSRRVASAASQLLAPAPRRVINATGVVVHTNLGRSVLSEDAARRVAESASGYVDLEYDVQEGARGDRASHLAPLLERLFPGHASAVFNNNAAALVVTLRALAKGKEVIVSRGELVEIGGSFRVPEILAVSGARLHEVGTTNRTRLSDYTKAIGPRSGAILKVHTSNFRIVGFTEETPLRALAELAHASGVPLIVDWGSGDLVDLAPLGIHDELPVRSILDAGADLVTFSCDKLLGGPQAGLVVGRADLVAKIRRDPMARVCRIDRLLVAALHATLAAYVRGRAFEEIPTLRMLALTPEQIGKRAAAAMRKILQGAPTARKYLHIADGVSRTGGGSSPGGERPTRLISVEGDAGALEQALRAGDPPVIARIHGGRLLLDLRTVLPSQDEMLVATVVRVLTTP